MEVGYKFSPFSLIPYKTIPRLYLKLGHHRFFLHLYHSLSPNHMTICGPTPSYRPCHQTNYKEMKWKKLFISLGHGGHAVARLVEVLRYKSEGRRLGFFIELWPWGW